MFWQKVGILNFQLVLSKLGSMEKQRWEYNPFLFALFQPGFKFNIIINKYVTVVYLSREYIFPSLEGTFFSCHF